MNKTAVSKEIILAAGKEIAVQSGLQALNIRTLAHHCGVSTGTIYNYFPSKGDLMVATVEAVWAEIMYGAQELPPQQSFVESLQTLFLTVEKGFQKYPSFFNVHALSIADLDKTKGRKVMGDYFQQMKNRLLQVLRQDPNVREDAFSHRFTQVEFVEFLFSNILTLLMRGGQSCDFLLQVVRRSIY